MVGGMTGQGAIAGATMGYGIGTIIQKKREDRKNIKEGTEAVKMHIVIIKKVQDFQMSK